MDQELQDRIKDAKQKVEDKYLEIQDKLMELEDLLCKHYVLYSQPCKIQTCITR